MSKGLVYLAGPIKEAGSYAGATEWRVYAAEALANEGVRCLSPMRCKEYLQDQTLWLKSMRDHEGAVRGRTLSTPKGIVTRDRFDVSRCDVMIANFLGFTHVSIGTCIEFGWAHSFNTPVIMVVDAGGQNPHHHAMLKEIAGYVVPSLDEAINVTLAVLG